MKCYICEKELLGKQIKFCSSECARKHYGKKRYERICSGCGKTEYVSNSTQVKRKCRSCSQLGNTHSKNMSEEARRKISESRKGKVPWNKGKKGIYSDETRRKMGLKNKGRKNSPEARKKISEKLYEYYRKHEHHNKSGALSEEHKQKIKNSLNNIGPEIKKQINKRRSETCKASYWSKTEQERQDISKKIGLSGISFTNRELLSSFKIYNLKPILTIPNNEDRFSLPVRQKIRCFCGRVWEVYVYEILKGRTRSCGCQKSLGELEIYKFLTQKLGISEDKILKNKRFSFMNNLEIDLYLPEYKLGIEYHGLAHHSERPVFGAKDLRKVKTIHEQKYLWAKEASVTLLQIFEDEWIQKQEIVKSIIKNKLGFSQQIYARQCEIIEDLTEEEILNFLNGNHIQGYTKGIKSFGLKYKNDLIMLITFRKPWTKKYGNVIEIARLSSKLGYSVVGGFSRLLKRAEDWAGSEKYDGILTYADCRYGVGKVYENNGFFHIGKTKPNYFYEKGGIREHRFKHRKSENLEGDTEREQQNKLGWYAIYDAGNEVYVLTLAPK